MTGASGFPADHQRREAASVEHLGPLRQFYRNPLSPKSPQTDADGPATDQPRMIRAVPGDSPQVVMTSSGMLVQQTSWSSALPRYFVRAAILVLFAVSILKLSAQSYSPFLYFQF